MTARNPFDRSHAVGSKWTARRPENEEKHFEVVAFSGKGVELRCVLNGHVRSVEMSALRDPEDWQPGWL